MCRVGNRYAAQDGSIIELVSETSSGFVTTIRSNIPKYDNYAIRCLLDMADDFIITTDTINKKIPDGVIKPTKSIQEVIAGMCNGSHIEYPYDYYHRKHPTDTMRSTVTFVYNDYVVTHFFYGGSSVAEDIKYDDIILVLDEDGDYLQGWHRVTPLIIDHPLIKGQLQYSPKLQENG